jgi:4-hydroxybenzoate polyprenyltransferase
MFWVAGFDIIYACQDVKIDRDQDLYSLPARLGKARALWLSRLSHLAAIACLVGLMFEAELSWLYLIGVVAMAGLLLWEHTLVRGGAMSRVHLAFMTANGAASIAMGVLGILDIMLAGR